MAPKENRPGKLFGVFKNVFSTAFAQNDAEGVGVSLGDMGYDLTDTGGTVAPFDAGLSGGSGLSTLDLPSREVTNIDGGYDALSRRQRYASYEQLEELVPEIHAAVNTYADEVCSYDDQNHVMRVVCSNGKVKEELEFLFFHPQMIDIDNKSWGLTRNVCKYGDGFWELVIDGESPHFGVLKINELDPHTMWRIQSRRGTLLEFQQTLGSPDYEVVSRDIKEKYNTKKNPHLHLNWESRGTRNAKLIRFAPAQVVHVRIGSEERGFKPYGISIVQAARRPAYNLRLMEDSMLLYRLSRGTERRVYYVDVGQMAGAKVDSYIEDFKKRTKRKRIYDEKTNQVDERYNPWSVDDDLYVPVRPNMNTRVESLPGAQNLSDIDDALYFRKKLYVALKIPQGYLEQSVESATNRLSLTSLDMRFAKVVFRIQKAIANALREIAIRHLVLIGVPREEYEDLEIIMTPSSEWREMAQAEVIQNRVNIASSIASMGLNIDRGWIKSNILRMTEEEIEEQEINSKREQVEAAEMEGTKMLVAARYQAEVDRGNLINQTKIQQAAMAAQQQQGEMGGAGEGGDQAAGGEDMMGNAVGDGGTERSIPSEEDLLRAASGDPDNPIPELDRQAKKKESLPPRFHVTQADIEADRESIS